MWYYHTSWQGARCAPLCNPRLLALERALNPSRASKTYRRFTTRKGAFCAPLHPIDQRAFHSPSEPSTTSWRRFQRDHSHGDQPSADWMPIRSFATRYPRRNSRRLDRRQHFAAEPRPRIVLGCANQKPLYTLRFFLFTCVSVGYTLSMKDSGLRIRIERELREKFIEVCRQQDRPAAQVIREFMRQYIAEHEQPVDKRKTQLKRL